MSSIILRFFPCFFDSLNTWFCKSAIAHQEMRRAKWFSVHWEFCRQFPKSPPHKWVVESTNCVGHKESILVILEDHLHQSPMPFKIHFTIILILEDHLHYMNTSEPCPQINVKVAKSFTSFPMQYLEFAQNTAVHQKQFSKGLGYEKREGEVGV